MNKNYKIVTPPKRVSDWKGKKVVSKYEVHNGLGSMPKGSVFTIKHSGIRKALYSDRCQCCGFSYHFDTKATAEQFIIEFDFIEEEPQA
jgi:hypothetical protein